MLQISIHVDGITLHTGVIPIWDQKFGFPYEYPLVFLVYEYIRVTGQNYGSNPWFTKNETKDFLHFKNFSSTIIIETKNKVCFTSRTFYFKPDS